MASNMAPVTSLPWLELFKVKVRTSAARSITTPLSEAGLESACGFLLGMAARYIRKAEVSNGADRKIHIRADARAKYGTVKRVLNEISKARIENVCFFAERVSP
jgi:hypothetical protein